MPQKSLTALVACLGLALALTPLACSKSKKTEGEAATTAAPAPANVAAAPARRAEGRAVRTEGRIERLDDKVVVFRLADGTSLSVARGRVRLPDRPRPALAVGQSHPLTVRYDEAGALLNVRIRRAANGKDRAR